MARCTSPISKARSRCSSPAPVGNPGAERPRRGDQRDARARQRPSLRPHARRGLLLHRWSPGGLRPLDPRGLGPRRSRPALGRPPQLRTRTFGSFPDTVLPVYSCDVRSPVLPAVASRRTGLWVPVVGRRSALGRHAAALTDGHVSQDADRLASTRARRAAAARDVRSAGTASPVPKYISSGVCPRNAECGSTRLCSST